MATRRELTAAVGQRYTGASRTEKARILDQLMVVRGFHRKHTMASALRRSIPVRTSADWKDPAPGFVEADLVAHSGPSARGSFIQTLVLTDIATGWTECAPLLVREQTLLSTVLTELRRQLPFSLQGIDTGNDSVFINETLKAYCEQANIVLTRCRPCRDGAALETSTMRK